MINFRELYKQLNNIKGKDFFGQEKDENSPYYNPLALDCLLNPQKHLNVIKDSHINPCFEVITNDDGKDAIAHCGDCKDIPSKRIEALHNINKSIDCVDTLKTLKSGRLTFALIAPAFTGQFGVLQAGQLRAALKAIGFDGVIEVALFADILTLKEAIEFDRNIRHEGDFQITSCCCPIWIAMIKKIYAELMPHLPPSVSPMIASGRVIKLLYPQAATVFIGPCLAKRAESKEPDIADAVDRVLTFTEIRDIFTTLNIDPTKYESIDKEHSSFSGRVYARRHGVSEAVLRTIKRLNPNRTILPVAEQADGVQNCRKMIDAILNGGTKSNFFEGMGCVGGCVGGPKACISKETATENVNNYADSAPYNTPLDNPYIIELLHRIGIDTDDDLLESSIFNRKWDVSL